jgi:uncharacterized protein RhaS with RHS repeats
MNEERRIERIFYDADGNRTDDSSRAVSAETVEVDASGKVVRKLEGGGLDWKVEQKSIEGDLGELATRPRSSRD